MTAQAEGVQTFRGEVLRVLAAMLGKRFVFPSMATAVTELKAAYEAFSEGMAKVGKEDLEALRLIETVSDQSRMLGERETGKDFGAKLAEAYCDMVAFRASA